jgi:hypothetical protein
MTLEAGDDTLALMDMLLAKKRAGDRKNLAGGERQSGRGVKLNIAIHTVFIASSTLPLLDSASTLSKRRDPVAT